MAAQYVKVEQIAQLFGVSVRRVQQLTQEGIIQSEKVEGQPGRMYDFLPTVQKYIAYLSDKASGRQQSDKVVELKSKKLEVDIALKESQNELHRLKTDIQAGRYISVEEAQLDYTRFFVVLKKFITAIPSRVSMLIGSRLEPSESRELEKDLGKELSAMLCSFVSSAVPKKREDGREPSQNVPRETEGAAE